MKKEKKTKINKLTFFKIKTNTDRIDRKDHYDNFSYVLVPAFGIALSIQLKANNNVGYNFAIF